MSLVLNQQQLKAVNEFDHDLLVTAGAGTGKTRVLTLKYLSLLKECRLETPQIVAVTFTKKAADEMRARIRDGIKEECANSIGSEREFWLRQLEALETSAHISTIHGLCNSLLAEHPVESGVNPKAEVMDEGEIYLLQSEAADEALNLVLAGKNGRQAAKVLLEQGVDFFAKELAQVYQEIRESGLALEEVHRISAEYLAAGLARLAPGDPRQLLCQGVEEFVQLAKSLQKLSPKAQEHLDELVYGWEQFKTVIIKAECFDEDLKSALTWLLSLLPRNTMKDLKSLTNEARRRVEVLKKTLLTNKARQQLPLIMEYLQCFDQEYQDRKRQTGKMDFGDQQLLARDLLVNYPEVARAYQERFAYFLIDEVQDTNSLQWDILSRLIYRNENTEHSGYIHKEGYKEQSRRTDQERLEEREDSGSLPKGRVFLVGDIKQSIYRFRGAEVEVITDLAAEFSAGSGETLVLAENYRTLRPVAAVINELCQRVFASEDYSYHPLAATRNREKERESRVEMLIMNDEEKEDEPEILAARIRELVESGLTLKDAKGARKAGYGDIALLFRTTTHLRAYEEAFRRRGIPFLVNMGTGFYARPEIQDQISLLRLVENPADSLALAEVLRSPFCALSDHELFWLAHPDGLSKGFYNEDLPEQIGEKTKERLCHLRNLLRNWQKNLHLLTITDLLELIMKETSYLTVTISLPDGKRRLANLEKFQHRAGDFVRKGYSGVRGFVTFIEQLTTLSVREGEAPAGKEDDVVQMMTVHAAKGLEFPIVVLPELGQRFKVSRTSPVFFHKKMGLAHKVFVNGTDREDTLLTEEIKESQRREELSELKRLFYVALTRAEDYLLLAGRFTKRQSAEDFDEAGSWLEWIYQAIPDLTQVETGEADQIEWQGQQIKLTWGRDYISPDSIDRPQISTEMIEEKSLEKVPATSEEEKSQQSITEHEIAATVLPQVRTEKKGMRFRRVALSPLLTFMQCPRRFYWEHRLGMNGDYVEVADFTPWPRETSGLKTNEPESSTSKGLRPLARSKGRPFGVALGEVFHRLVAMGGDAEYKKEELESYFTGLSEPEIKKALALLATMYENYAKSPFYPRDGVKTFNEYPFLLHLGEAEKVAIKGTIDRILLYPDGEISVVDFKTNQRVPTAPVLQEYKKQISIYSLAVGEIFGRLPKKAFIYFVRPSTIITCPISRKELSKAKTEIMETVDFLDRHDQPEAYITTGQCGTCPFTPWCEGSESSILYDEQKRYDYE